MSVQLVATADVGNSLHPRLHQYLPHKKRGFGRFPGAIMDFNMDNTGNLAKVIYSLERPKEIKAPEP
jgi:hypothetical protein